MQSTRGCGPFDPGDGQSPPEGSPLLDLAPYGGCMAASIAARAGGLLHHLFTLTPTLFPPLNPRDFGEVQGRCGMSLSPYPSGCPHNCCAGGPVPGVTRRIALWSADFPQWLKAIAVIRPAWEDYLTIDLRRIMAGKPPMPRSSPNRFHAHSELILLLIYQFPLQGRLSCPTIFYLPDSRSGMLPVLEKSVSPML